MSDQARIVLDSGVRSGKPCIPGTRITVYDVLEYLAGGMSQEELLADFPSLEAEDVLACLRLELSPGSGASAATRRRGSACLSLPREPRLAATRFLFAKVVVID